MKDENKKDKDKKQEVKKNFEHEVKELRQRIEELEAEKDLTFEKLQRVIAEYQNFEKRMLKKNSETIAYEKEALVKSLLPALDNFDHTLQNAHKAEDIGVIVKGVDIVYAQLMDVLKSYGVERICSVGEKFDPTFHQALMQKQEADKENYTVLEEFQKGYRIGDRVLRPSRVVVNILPSEEEAVATEEPEPEIGCDE